MTGALDGLRVLDLSRILAGPFATQNLADLGADVVKVEAPWGDDTRSWGPPFIGTKGHQSAAYFHSCNRGKRSISVDMKTEDGLTLLKELIGQADIVVENMKAGTLTRIGLDPNILIRDNPKLIICQITGFGQTGPRSMQPGYDVALQGMSGIMSVTGEADGPPVKVGVAWIDVLTGFAATSAILAALHHRDRTGEGQIIDLSLFDVALMSMVNQAQNWIASGDIPRPMGHAHPNIVPYQAFQANNGWFILATGNDSQYFSVCHLIERQDLCSPPYDTNAGRLDSRAYLIDELQSIFIHESIDYWLTNLGKVGVPCSPIMNISEALMDQHSDFRNAIWTLDDGSSSVASAFRFLSSTPAIPGRPPPELDQHRSEIIRDWLS
jgi:crotonobetainyl-CoA:carnitine CoA-transferase CaiB-like acyl-CoA transferase